jgi:hypothetical protein
MTDVLTSEHAASGFGALTRSSEDKQKVAQDALAAIVAARRGQSPVQSFGPDVLEARRDQARLLGTLGSG